MDKGLITIIYDNQSYDRNLKSGWGFSCLVEHSNKLVLFDTGSNPAELLFNLSGLDISPENFDAVVLSHNHWDHTGGLEAVIGKNRKCIVYFGQSYPENFKQDFEQKEIKYVLIKKQEAINREIFVGPEMAGSGGTNEIPLIVGTHKGLIIITGCAHPGIVKIVKEVKKSLNKDIYMVLGGFHLVFSLQLGKVMSEFRKIGVKKVGPSHCTGSRAINLFQEEFKEDFIKVGSGLRIDI